LRYRGSRKGQNASDEDKNNVFSADCRKYRSTNLRFLIGSWIRSGQKFKLHFRAAREPSTNNMSHYWITKNNQRYCDDCGTDAPATSTTMENCNLVLFGLYIKSSMCVLIDACPCSRTTRTQPAALTVAQQDTETVTAANNNSTTRVEQQNRQAGDESKALVAIAKGMSASDLTQLLACGKLVLVCLRLCARENVCKSMCMCRQQQKSGKDVPNYNGSRRSLELVSRDEDTSGNSMLEREREIERDIPRCTSKTCFMGLYVVPKVAGAHATGKLGKNLCRQQKCGDRMHGGQPWYSSISFLYLPCALSCCLSITLSPPYLLAV
jgi:hypothetical protein